MAYSYGQSYDFVEKYHQFNDTAYSISQERQIELECKFNDLESNFYSNDDTEVLNKFGCRIVSVDREEYDHDNKEDKKTILAALDTLGKSKTTDITSMNGAACALSSCLRKATYFDYNFNGERNLIGVYRANDKDTWLKLPTAAITEEENCLIVKNLSNKRGLSMLIHHKETDKCKF